VTDTARTLADIKARLASNVHAGISAQTIRDVVESIVNPVPGGGMATGYLHTSEDASWLGRVASFSLLNNVVTPVPLTYSGNIDNASIAQAGSYTSSWYGQTFAAGTWGRFPAGLWQVLMHSRWETPNTTGYRWAGIDIIDDRIADPGIDGFYFDPGYNIYDDSYESHPPATLLSDQAQVHQRSEVVVTPAMVAAAGSHSDAGLGVAYGFVARQTSGVTMNLLTQVVQIRKVGETK